MIRITKIDDGYTLWKHSYRLRLLVQKLVIDTQDLKMNKKKNNKKQPLIIVPRLTSTSRR